MSFEILIDLWCFIAINDCIKLKFINKNLTLVFTLYLTNFTLLKNIREYWFKVLLLF